MLVKNGWSQAMIKDALRYGKDSFYENENMDYLKGLMR